MDTRVHVSTVIENDESVLMVQENKPRIERRWNLPGGHVELHESIPDAAVREVLEETNLSVRPTSLVGVYAASFEQNYFVRFVFRSEIVSGHMQPGADQLDVAWKPIREIIELPNDQLVGAAVLRSILSDTLRQTEYPLELLNHQSDYR